LALQQIYYKHNPPKLLWTSNNSQLQVYQKDYHTNTSRHKAHCCIC